MAFILEQSLKEVIIMNTILAMSQFDTRLIKSLPVAGEKISICHATGSETNPWGYNSRRRSDVERGKLNVGVIYIVCN